MIFPDYSRETQRKREAFSRYKKALHERKIKFGMLYPARLKFFVSGPSPWVFYDPEKAMKYIERRWGTCLALCQHDMRSGHALDMLWKPQDLAIRLFGKVTECEIGGVYMQIFRPLICFWTWTDNFKFPALHVTNNFEADNWVYIFHSRGLCCQQFLFLYGNPCFHWPNIWTQFCIWYTGEWAIRLPLFHKSWT